MRFDQLDEEMRIKIRRDYISEGIYWKEFQSAVAEKVEFFANPRPSKFVPGRTIIGQVIQTNWDGSNELFVMEANGTFGFVGPEPED